MVQQKKGVSREPFVKKKLLFIFAVHFAVHICCAEPAVSDTASQVGARWLELCPLRGSPEIPETPCATRCDWNVAPKWALAADIPKI